MTILLLGLAMFYVAHLVPATPLRGVLAGALGENKVKLVITVLSFAGLIVAVLGYQQVPVEYVFPPKPWARAAALHGMPIAFILLASAHMPTHIRQWLRHPMMLGVLIWSVLHYFANGERAAVWFFGSFAVYAVFAIISGTLRGQSIVKPGKQVAWKFDLMAVGGGIILYGVVMAAHGWLFNRVLIG
ncbi:MAG: NnrU family protein [Gammaproteobacteria bacterium]